MKKNNLTKYTLSGIILMAFLFSCGSIAPEAKVQEWLKKGAFIADVRTPEEFSTWNFPGSVNIPLADIEKRINEFWPKDRFIIVYCRSGNRSGKAKSVLESAGYKNVLNGGGINDMKKIKP